MKHVEIWEETISEAAEECNLQLTAEQLSSLADAVAGTHDNFDLVHYTPSISDHYESERRKATEAHKRELEELEHRRQTEQDNATEYARNLRYRLVRAQEELAKYRWNSPPTSVP